MSDDLTAQVEEWLFDMLNNPDIPEDDAGELAHELAPRIAACMRAVARCGIDLDAIDDGIHTPSEVERIAEEQENACLAAGLAALRGET